MAVDGVVFNLANPLGTMVAGLLIAPLGARAVLAGMAVLAVVMATVIVLTRRGLLWLGINEKGELDDPRLAVRAIEPDAERGIPSPVPAPGSLVNAVVEEVEARHPDAEIEGDEDVAGDDAPAEREAPHRTA